MSYVAYVSPRDGIPRRVALISMDREDALREAGLLAAATFGTGYTFIVRSES